MVIFIIQSLNSAVIKQNDKKYSSVEYQNKVEDNKQKKRDKEFITNFINLCNEGNIEEAYRMLSYKCKEEKFNSIEKFEKEYVNKKFYINICDYKIIKSEDIYTVRLIQDMLVTGKTDCIIETTYKIEGVLENEIYIYN